LLEGDNSKKIKDLESKLKIGTINEHNCLISEFQMKNMLSYMIGPMKCYPAISDYAQKNGYKATGIAYEIYDEQVKKIFYAIEVEKLK
jgi:hypothetical protein